MTKFGQGQGPRADQFRRHLVCPERVGQSRDQQPVRDRIVRRKWILRASATGRTRKQLPEPAVGTTRAWVPLHLWLAGGGLLIATGAIHLDLYLIGHWSILTIGWLFLFQVIAAFVLGVAVLASAARLAAAAG